MHSTRAGIIFNPGGFFSKGRPNFKGCGVNLPNLKTFFLLCREILGKQTPAFNRF